MSLVLKSRVEESANAESFKIFDISTGWGTDGDPDSGSILAAALVIDSQRYAAVNYDMLTIASRWTEFLSSDGHEVLIASIYPTLSGFPDDFYSIRLIINSDGDPLFDGEGAVIEANVEFSYDNNQGFLAYAREAARKLPLPQDWDNFDFKENEEQYRIYMLLDGAEEDANLGNVTRFEAKMNYISEQLNQRGIEYVY